MKKIKNLSILLVAVIMSSTGLVSCIDNDVSPNVEEIYKNQALLIASQASLNDAKANYQNALAAVQEVKAIADANAAALEIREGEEALDKAIAMNAIALENALMQLEKAKLIFEAQMIALQASIDRAHVVLATQYFGWYNNMKSSAMAVEAAKLTKETALADAQLLLKGNVTWEFYLAAQNQLLLDLQGNLAAEEAAAAALEAVIADPSTAQAKSTELQEMKDVNTAAMDALDIQIAEKQAESIPFWEDLADLNDLDVTYHNAENALNIALSAQEGYEDDIQDRNDWIADNIADIATYDTDLSTAEGEAATATTNASNAVTALGTGTPLYPVPNNDVSLIGAPVAPLTSSGAHNDYEAAHTAWYKLDGEVSGLAANVNAAAAAWDAQKILTASAAALVISTEATVLTTEATYIEAKAIFDNPLHTGAGYAYTAAEAGPDAILGEYIVNTNTLTANIYLPLIGVAGGVASFGLPTSVLPAGVDLSGTLPGTYGVFAPGDFIQAGLDDIDITNQARYDAATIAYDAAKDARDAAVIAEPLADQALIDAKKIYDDLNVVLVSGVQDLVILEAAVQTAMTDLSSAQGLVNSTGAISIAKNAVVAGLVAYDKEDMQDDIDLWEHQILEITILLGVENGAVIAAQANYDEALAALEGASTVEGEAIVAAIDAIAEEIDAFTAEKTALTSLNFQYQLVINAITGDLSTLQTQLDAMNVSIAGILLDIEKKEVVIAKGEIDLADAEADIVACEAAIAEMQVRIDGFNELAAKYWDLMQAALAA